MLRVKRLNQYATNRTSCNPQYFSIFFKFLKKYEERYKSEENTDILITEKKRKFIIINHVTL